MRPAIAGRPLLPLLLALVTGWALARAGSSGSPDEEVLRRLERQEARWEALARRLEASAPPPATTSACAPTGADLTAVREDLRQLREELLRVVPTATAPTPETKPTPLSWENNARFAEAHRWVEDRMATGRWGDAQRAELHAWRGQLKGEQYQALLMKLVVEVNAQRLRVETTHGPPF
ncbi:hypothetical protein G4177_32015 [Corallococcus sp. ZKHCc1 1396]|uniref:Uncharacterized protein n=1 Tax=Corallococcus soli TaxID=2710757 RepID=A0ABR9PXY7_9BACT|nr:hypothetical protein [Corallococcus soli]MBE4752793.1 hypothetical protein [Corallococcus soli]